MPRVALRLARLDVGAEEAARCAALLDPEETARAARFRFAEHRRRFTVRRARLRQWLGAELGCAPADVRIATDPRGKPYVVDWPGQFSCSHSRDMAVVAISDVALGVDIEAVDSGLDWRGIAVRLFAPEEQAELAGLSAEGFFRCWARKEAFVKALGEGLAHPLDAFAVSCGAEARLLRGGAGWAIAAVDIPDFAGAVVARDDGAPLVIEVISAS